MQSGFGEMCHYFIVSGEKDFKNYIKDYEDAFESKSALSRMVFNSLQIKKNILK